MTGEEVWKANREKVGFVKSFPGRIQAWDEALGKTVKKVVRLPGRSGGLLIFEDGSYAPVPKLDPDPADLLAGLLAARSELEAGREKAYRDLDLLVEREKKLLRRARLDKILGAVTHNMPAIPELKEELLKLLSKM